MVRKRLPPVTIGARRAGKAPAIRTLPRGIELLLDVGSVHPSTLAGGLHRTPYAPPSTAGVSFHPSSRGLQTCLCRNRTFRMSDRCIAMQLHQGKPQARRNGIKGKLLQASVFPPNTGLGGAPRRESHPSGRETYRFFTARSASRGPWALLCSQSPIIRSNKGRDVSGQVRSA
jgi:hypothetical protein